MTSLQIVVLDEADRMLDMGFAPQLNQILDALPEQRQTLLFSATLPADLVDLARVSVQNPVRAMADKPATPAAGVTQTLHQTTPQEKTRLLLSLLKGHAESVLVFTRTKHRADRLGEALTRDGHRVAVLHGNRALSQRRRALERFRSASWWPPTSRLVVSMSPTSGMWSTTTFPTVPKTTCIVSAARLG